MEAIFVNIKKYGVTGVLVAWLWYTDNRLSKVEQQLWDCYKTQTASIFDGTNNGSIFELFAVLPQKSKYIINHKINTI